MPDLAETAVCVVVAKRAPWIDQADLNLQRVQRKLHDGNAVNEVVETYLLRLVMPPHRGRLREIAKEYLDHHDSWCDAEDLWGASFRDPDRTADRKEARRMLTHHMERMKELVAEAKSMAPVPLCSSHKRPVDPESGLCRTAEPPVVVDPGEQQ
jgi:hypothetical protein